MAARGKWADRDRVDLTMKRKGVRVKEMVRGESGESFSRRKVAESWCMCLT
jgi:hypothetical protein